MSARIITYKGAEFRVIRLDAKPRVPFRALISRGRHNFITVEAESKDEGRKLLAIAADRLLQP